MRCMGHLQGEHNDVTDTALPRAGTGVADHATRAGIRHLGDFTTSPRVLLIAAIALVVGTGGVIGGVILLNLIRLCTNIAYYGVVSLADLKPAGSPLGVARGSSGSWRALAARRSVAMAFRRRSRRSCSAAAGWT